MRAWQRRRRRSHFGTGSSREQAAFLSKGLDLIIVANNYSRIFLQNAVTLGCGWSLVPGVQADEGDELEFRAVRSRT